ncbi:hypothetical protein A8709_15705 [Paenibacillus pectinilyticus]|uniref:HTH araC/xylS-type domain-containing protein n=1 Tax=Paenibacillus pectinilyticus TaxID=512399 RepID=A0A1C1A4N2_9BACL|nr:AraC family transcriptional regulator [Paenibacillus pectinilyticus]OCT15519.1 hypothetical protein A8709_15705 [Paenibacillus pectinilyticus]
MENQVFALDFNPWCGNGEAVVLFSGEHQTEACQERGPQVLDYYLMHLVLSGKGRFQTRGNTFELRAGQCFFIFPNELTSYAAMPDDPWHYRWVGFTGSRVQHILTSIGVTPHHPVIHLSHLQHAKYLCTQIQATLNRGAAYCDLEATGYLLLLFAACGPIRSMEGEDKLALVKRHIQKQVREAIHVLHERMPEKVSIAEIALKAGYNPSHFSKMFKSCTGMTPNTYLLQLRMEHAKLLLKKTLTIQEIASQVGYEDPLYFSRRFKAYFGFPPNVYRKMHEMADSYHLL